MQKMLMAFGQMDPWTAGYVVVGLALILVLMAAYALKNAEEDPDECDCTPEHPTIPEALVKHHSLQERYEMRVFLITEDQAEKMQMVANARKRWAKREEIEEGL